MSTWLWWSSGKDSAWALHELRAQGVEVTGLVTTVDASAGSVAVHGVPRALLKAQAAAVGVPLREVPLPSAPSNAQYQHAVGEVAREARRLGVTAMAYGDLFLEEIRDYRVGLLEGTGIEARFPLWGRGTADLAHEMLAAGLRAVVTCVDAKALPASFAGRAWDQTFLADLPEAVDPCGENGEFHTFAWAGPMFGRPLPLQGGAVRTGQVAGRDGFIFAEWVGA